MSLALAFWIVMLLWLAFGVYRKGAVAPFEGLAFLLLVIVGWAVFGAPIK